MKKVIMALLCMVSLNCYSQDSWNMQVWKKNGGVYQFKADEIDSVTFTKTSNFRDWQNLMRFPTVDEINQVNNTNQCRSPYITTLLDTDVAGGFLGYAIDFKADLLPSQTYCSLANFQIDYSSLKEKYNMVWNEGGAVNAYAGFQSASEADGNPKQGILSIWDSYGIGKSQKIDTIRASLVYPEATEGIFFDHEDDGMSYRPQYDWNPGKWYRIYIQCVEPQDGGNTQMEFWVCDLDEKREWKKLCVFDLGAQGLFFSGKTGAFLENWLPASSADLRTMEFKNVRIFTKEKGDWKNIYTGTMYPEPGNENICYQGSYQYGTDDTSFWMITTGVPNCASPQQKLDVKVTYAETGDPLMVNK